MDTSQRSSMFYGGCWRIAKTRWWNWTLSFRAHPKDFETLFSGALLLLSSWISSRLILPVSDSKFKATTVPCKWLSPCLICALLDQEPADYRSILLAQQQHSPTADIDLRNRISSLEDSRRNLQARITNSQHSIHGDSSNGREKLRNLDQFLQTSEPVLSSATAYIGSLSGSTVGGSSDVAGSISGLDPGRRSAIDTWRGARIAGKYSVTIRGLHS